MAAPILATKLYIPVPRAKIVLRARLMERLNEGLRRKLTLISAPAGFGKTTLLSEWVAACERPAAWLSLDRGDNDPTRFLSYLVAALQTLDLVPSNANARKLGERVLDALQSPQPPAAEALLTPLLNEIAAVPESFVLILDDYHVIESGPVDNALTFLLEHLPRQVHLVIATREDPDLPLARYRARDQLTELRVKDLRFTPAEAADFLNRVMGLNLSADDIVALETRTEGWIAGLHLAAISMLGHENAASFVRSFAGSHQFVMDYLVEEVLQQQSESIQSFLLRTSILDRLCGSLCDAILPESSASGQETLEYLERANLMVLPLDDRRGWYRYHHLFTDVLQARLMQEQPDQVADLHLRASAWWEQNDSRSDAIRHALAARAFERAADLIELDWSVNSSSYFQRATWLGWLKALPDELVRTRPRLHIGHAWELLFSGELEAAADRMAEAERLLDLAAATGDPSPVTWTGSVSLSDEQSRALRASLALARAYHAQALGDAAGAEKHAHSVLTLISEPNHYMRGLAGSLLGIAWWTRGELDRAYQQMAEAMANLRRAGNLLYATSCTFVLADIRIAQGRLSDAASIYEEALQLALARGEPILQGTADLHLGLSALYHERGNWAAASQHLQIGEELGERAALPEWPAPLHLARARIKQAEGDLDGALELLDQAELLHARSPVPDVRPIAALKARIWIAQGRLAEAIKWVQRQALSVADDLSYLREFEHITLARLLIADDQSERAERSIQDVLGLLERLLEAAEHGGRKRSAIEILMLQALAHQAQGNIPWALEPLERALTLAEPEGYVSLFLDEGRPLAELLRWMSREGGSPVSGAGSRRAPGEQVKDYLQTLLAAFRELEEARPTSGADGEHGRGAQDVPSSPRASSTRSPSHGSGQPSDQHPLIEPLSQRELEVLQLIAQGLSNWEISERLFLAMSTVKGHNRNIYGKLQVKRRTEAVARARELGLV